MPNKNNNKDVADNDTDPTSELELPTWRRADVSVVNSALEIDADTAGLDRTIGRPSKSRDLEFRLEQKLALIKGLEAERKSQNAIIQDLNTALKETQLATDTLANDLAAGDELLSAENAEKLLLSQQRDALEAELAALQEDQQQRRDELAGLEKTLTEMTRDLEEKDQELGELQSSLKSAKPKFDDDGPSPAVIAAFRQEIKHLQQRLSASERLNDQTRQAMQDAVAEKRAAAQRVTVLQDELHELQLRSHDQLEELAELKANEQDLMSRLDSIEADHAEEMRLLRFELTEAEESIGQHEIINQQLTTDLVENRSRKHDLESQLSSADATARDEISTLQAKLQDLMQKNEEAHSQLNSKDDAVRCLLNELAQHRNAEDRPTSEAVSDDTGENLNLSVDEHESADKVSRYLTGVVDGQDVRFPLFKPRLTIGRTQANDLQLSPNFISRRHAVIVTDGGQTRIIDWGSRNGIKVNDEPVKEHFLESGDKVSVGTFEFLYEERRRT